MVKLLLESDRPRTTNVETCVILTAADHGGRDAQQTQALGLCYDDVRILPFPSAALKQLVFANDSGCEPHRRIA